MGAEPTVSVVTGYYNRSELLRRTIESVLSQTYEDFELIVFDDCSTDGSSQVLRDLAAEFNDPRFRFYVHESNLGFVAGLRQAIALSKGKYVAIQGSGDVSLPKRLELQVDLLNSRPDLVAVGGWYTNVQELQGTFRVRQPVADDISFLDLCSANVFSHGEVMFRRDAYEGVGGYRCEFRYSQDYDLWLRLIQVGAFATVPSVIYERFVQFDGVSYVPEKIVQQACFARAAVELSKVAEPAVPALLRRLATDGPEAIVARHDSRVQSELKRASLRLMLFGGVVAGRDLASRSIDGFSSRATLGALGLLLDSKLSRLVRPVLYRLVGIRRR